MSYFKGGNTATALREMEQVFQAEGVETEIVQVGSQQVRGCVACVPEMVKNLFSSSKVADSPPRRAATTLAPTFMDLSKGVL